MPNETFLGRMVKGNRKASSAEGSCKQGVQAASKEMLCCCRLRAQDFDLFKNYEDRAKNIRRGY